MFFGESEGNTAHHHLFLNHQVGHIDNICAESHMSCWRLMFGLKYLHAQTANKGNNKGPNYKVPAWSHTSSQSFSSAVFVPRVSSPVSLCLG